jgi:hypothetical protein
VTTVSFDGAEIYSDAVQALLGDPASAPSAIRVEWQVTDERSEYRRIVRRGLQDAFPDLVLPPIANPVTRRVVVPRAVVVQDDDGGLALEARPTESEPLYPWTS